MYFRLHNYFKLILSFWSLLSARDFNRNSSSLIKGFIKKLYFSVLILPYIKRLSQWRKNQNNAKLVEEANRSTQIFASVMSPYLHKKWKLIDRINAVEQHYEAVGDFASLLDLTSNQYFDLIQFEDEYADVRIVIDKPDWMRVEGEAVISFYYQEHRIHRLTFSIIHNESTPVIAIGGVQGWGGTETIGPEEIKEINVKLTKVLHGLHPKIFLLYMIRMLGAAWGMKEIWGVSDANHRSNHLFVKSEKFSSYDKFWLDHSGVENAQGFFVIPTEIKTKSHDEMPANKRARFKRRYEMLAQIRIRLNDAIKNDEPELKVYPMQLDSPVNQINNKHKIRMILFVIFGGLLACEFI